MRSSRQEAAPHLAPTDDASLRRSPELPNAGESAAESPPGNSAASALIIAASAVLLTTLALSAAVVSAELLLVTRSSSIAMLVIPVAVSLISPSAAVLLLVAALPVFGNRPATPQAIWLVYISSGVLVGATLRLVLRSRSPLLGVIRESETTLVLVWSYLIVSLLSLLSLPLQHLMTELRARAVGTDATVWSALIHSFVRLNEDDAAYPILTVFLTGQAIILGAIVCALGRERPRFVLHTMYAVLAGLVLSLGAGLLDYYGVVDLRSLRKLDPYANPWNAQFRMQSFFGHSGWFAEYVTLAVPSVLVILAARVAYPLRVAAILAVLLVGEYALILTFQRGGWLSYPLTLVAVWAAIYIQRRLERGETDVLAMLRRSALKVALSLPLTIVLSAGAMYAVSRSGLLSADVQTTADMYVDRLKDISRTSDRSKFFIAGALIGAMHPFLGAGSESFAIEFRREFRDPEGSHFGKIDLPLHGTAHNVYAQTFAGKGVLGLVLLVTLAFALVGPPLREVARREMRSSEERLALLFVASCGAAFLIYGVVQEVFYVQSLQLLFFTLCGVAAVFRPAGTVPARGARRLTAVLLFFLVGHLLWESAHPGPASAAASPQFGCYRRERDGEGRPYRWCSSRAGVVLPAADGAEPLRFSVKADVMSRRAGTLRVLYRGREIASLPVVPNRMTPIALPLPEGLTAEDRESRSVPLVIELNSHFIPHYALKSRGDFRILSFRLFTDG